MRLAGFIAAGLMAAGSDASLAGQAGKGAGAILQVPEAVMASRVVSKVQPDRSMMSRELGGTVVLSEVVDKDGFIEHIAVLSGPAPVRAAAVFAARQWSYKPYLVDGHPVAVETTATLQFPVEGGERDTAAGPVKAPDLIARAGAVTANESTEALGAGRSKSATPSNNAAQPGTADVHALRVASAGEGRERTDPRGVVGEPQMIASGVAPEPLPANVRSGYRAPGGPHAVLEPLPANSPEPDVTGVRISARWKIARRVGPVYPSAAALAGIEGVVVVQGTVKRDGTLHDVTAVSGPAELRQAAVDAAAQWEFVPSHRGEPQDTSIREPIEFLLKGPARVPADVMAGRVEHSVQPEYPAEAQAAGVTGSVTVHVLVGRQGRVETASVVSGPVVLREPALAAVKQWTWKPYLRNGVDQEVDTNVVVAFSMQWAGVQ